MYPEGPGISRWDKMEHLSNSSAIFVRGQNALWFVVISVHEKGKFSHLECGLGKLRSVSRTRGISVI